MKILYATTPPEPGHPNSHADYLFFCPGCKCAHGVWTTKTNTVNAIWTFNGNMEKPTFKPSILITHETWEPPVTAENLEQWKLKPWTQTKVKKVCHSFVTDGKIQFLTDCTHELAGRTVPLPEF